MKLKPIKEQVIVITGASSGIGLATARMAAARGAKVILSGRDEDSLVRAVTEIITAGGEAAWTLADVTDPDALRALSAYAREQFGGFDTWINNAGTSIYGRLWDVPVEEARRLFDINYWGMVQGSLVALESLRERGGSIINIGSVLSDRAVPLQGHYSATKHAVKAFTDALRMELEKDEVPVSVTLIKPSSIDTPFPQRAANYMDEEPKLPQPVYTPDVVAHAILACAEKPVREVAVGAGGVMISGMGKLIPRIMDRYMEATMFSQQQRDEPGGDGNLREPVLGEPPKPSGRERGNHPGPVMKSSLYTRASLNPGWTVLGVAAAGLGLLLAGRFRPNH